MTIGEKLKAARNGSGLTQEQVAEKVRVSRQTVSSWENDRSYPDIAGVLALAELYRLSLDELLREDKRMLRHLEESTNIVKSKKALSRRVLIAAYLLIWGVSIIFYYTGAGPTDAMAYALLFLYLLIPVSTLVVAFFVGRDEEWQPVRWLMLLFFGGMYMLVLTHHKTFVLPSLEDMLPGLLLAATGMGLGSLVRRLAERKGAKEVEQDAQA